MATYKVKLGAKANVFHDQTTGITVCKGESVELRSNQYHSRRVQMALNSGHLVLAPDEKAPEKYNAEAIEKLDHKMKAQFKRGMTIEKMAGSYTLEEAKLLAEKNSFETDENDTVVSILSAILEE